MTDNFRVKVRTLMIICLMLLSLGVPAILTEAGHTGTITPAGYQSYYVLGNSSCIIKEAVDVAAGFDPNTAQPYSVFSLVSYQNKSKIYVDHKSNGYTFNPEDFTGADAVFELEKGGVLTMDNWLSPYYTINPLGGGSLIEGSLQSVVGGDFFYVTGGPVNVFRGATDRQPGTGPDGNYIAGMWELYPVEYGGEDAQKQYIVPVGEDTLGTPDFIGLIGETNTGGTYLVVQGTADNTLVNYTIQHVPYSRALNRGDTFVIEHVYQGDTVEANNKIQVGMIASGGESWDIRYFTLPASNLTGNDYWIPTFPAGYIQLPVRYHIYAVTDADVVIESISGPEPGWNPRTLPAGTADTSFTTNGTKPLHIYAGEDQRIIILVAVDTGQGLWDWGYVPVDSEFFTTEYFIPYAPSGKNQTLDMQLLVTPLFDGTTIYADYNQDGIVEDSVTLNRFEAHGFYDDDMDNTGTHLYSDFEFTVVYGETGYAEPRDVNAGYDWGYTLIPPRTSNELVITKSIFPPVAPPCANITFTLTVTAGNVNVSGVDVWDILPLGFTYIMGSTTVTHPDSSETYPDPAIDGQKHTWDLNQYLDPGESLIVEFRVSAADIAGVEYMNLAIANGTDAYGNVFTPEARAFGRLTTRGVVFGTLMDVSGEEPEPIPQVTVYLTNCTDDTIINETQTDGNGLYYFLELLPGEYCVRYNSSDEDMGLLVPSWDSDPLVPITYPLNTSQDFMLMENCSYEHNFEADLPVDLSITKTGPISAIMGEQVTYTYTVENLGLKPAADVTVLDDICGQAVYMFGDTDMDGKLTPGETWIYTCQYITSLADPDPLTNIANVTTTDVDINPENNEADWTVDLLKVGLLVEKSLETSSLAMVGDTVTFMVNITNMGDAPLFTVPLNDTYDYTKLQYDAASPAPNSVNPGLLIWDDLTGGGSLTSGQSIQVYINYTAMDGTLPDVTVNHANVTRAAIGEGTYIGGYDTAEVSIADPGIYVEKTLKQPSGGTASIGENVVFTVKVTNIGNTPLITVPLRDSYDPEKLEYISATVTPDAIILGTLEWFNLTQSGALEPGNSITLELTYKAVNKTSPGVTVNTAEVINATTTIEGVLLGGEDDAEVRIAVPVGGEIIRPNLQYIWSIAVLIILAYAFSGLRRPDRDALLKI